MFRGISLTLPQELKSLAFLAVTETDVIVEHLDAPRNLQRTMRASQVTVLDLALSRL